MALATRNDVEAELLRPLTALEAQYVDRMLDRAERLVKRRVTDLDDRPDVDAEFAQLVVDVEAAAAARVYRNPDAKVQESDGTYSYSLNRLAASGLLDILDDEWHLLGYGHTAASIAPSTDAYVKLRHRGVHAFLVA